MTLRKWEDLPAFMRCPEVRKYYDILAGNKGGLILKRGFDMTMATFMLAVLAIPMSIMAVLIKMDSPGPIFYRQERITAYGKKFKIHKFRTMVDNADKMGASVTAGDDERITRIGYKIRRLRIDEIPQLIDVIKGDMSFVGARPEAEKYVKAYKPEYYATLLMPAGITSEASVRYKDEEKLLSVADDIDRVYIESILPEKMKWNLRSMEKNSFSGDLLTLFRTVLAVMGKEYSK